ncbi:interferon-induced protein 44-like [Clupea harengus]|uniref:Interferon-induced protein 44-like n=1 Tax=Clupea harengus TaxID=7950 RepID=A0A8M1KSF5_CLUHA|nr:interferon-induced protein 44-like [Clupea harengus]
MENKLREFCLPKPDLKHLRILLHGPVGTGKSSFINSINNVFQGMQGALVTTDSAFSFTKKVSGSRMWYHNTPQYYIKCTLSFFSAVIFNPDSPLSVGDADYITSPTLNDQVHCLVSVIPMDKISIMDDDVLNKMQAIREAIFMTMVDKACPVVMKDLRKIYFSKKIKEMVCLFVCLCVCFQMQRCSNRLGVPMNCIFPVKNYHEKTDLDQEMDCLILTALRQIVHFAHECIDSR